MGPGWPSITAGNLEDEVAVFILGTANKQTSAIEQLNLGLKNGAFLLHHLQRDIGSAAAYFFGGDFESAISGQGYHAGFMGAQAEALAGQQAVGRVVEHGLQLTNVFFQLRINDGVITRGQNSIHADLTAFCGQQR